MACKRASGVVRTLEHHGYETIMLSVPAISEEYSSRAYKL